ncbi:MAG: methyltransferase domain-containing protein [Desulfobacterales bacterium]|nr:MAG: methyltransferase domain-containing protein [Desulfobacterales bacterium]
MGPTRINSDSIVDVIFHLKWKSDAAVHTDGYQASRINIWRDYFPPVLLDALMNKEAGERLMVPLKKGEAVDAFTDRNLFDIKSSQFDRRFRKGALTEPRMGRFYPKGMVRGLAGVFRANVQPFRCVGLNNGHIKVDFNHPLAGKDLQLAVVVGKVGAKLAERGGTSIDWMDTLTSGPGMQTRWHMQQTDYFSDGDFERNDDQSDTIFYRRSRFVHHIDDTAREMVRNTYGRFLADGMQVLDLMSSWQSHIPARLKLGRLAGLGLNEDELKRNSQLTDHRVCDLNADPTLPFESNTFDAVVNTASVEYLTDPLAVFSEVSRVLRPDGYFIVTFSNRWFPTKAIKIWQELHEFERMGLVLEYFLRAGGFKDLQTYSIRGLPRPHDDKYFPELSFSDPVYAVWGRKR